jgi:hypothetical protein
MIQSRFALNTEENVRRALAECSDDEIALDSLAQWGSSPVGKNAGYGVEENHPIIRENLSSRFNISDAIASEYVSRLREYDMQFLLSGADINYVRAKIFEQLKTEAGRKWREGIQRRLSKSSLEAKRLTYLLLYLISRGFNAKTFETSLDEIQALYSATFESSFQVFNMQEELMDIGIFNRLIFTSEDSLTKQYVHAVNSMFSVETLGLKAEDLKIQTESKDLISHMIDKKMFDQLRLLDEVSSENFGIKRIENGLGSFVPDKRAFGRYKNCVAVSPFLLEEIRDDIHERKQKRFEEYESRIENSLFNTINDSWPRCKIDFLTLKREQALWRLDNGANPKMYIYLTLWTTESDLEILRSKLEPPNTSSLIAIVLNEPLDTARTNLKKKLGNCGELSLICPLNQKEVKVQTLAGSSIPFSTEIIESLTRTVNGSSASKKSPRPEPKEINQDAQVGREPERPKILIGNQGTRGIYWIPTRERNSNIAILGDAQSGKTQVIKRILVELRRDGLPFLVVDSSGEYLPKESSNTEFGTVVGTSEIAINPLELDIANSPRDQKYRVLQILDAVYGLKDWEIPYIRIGIERAYEVKGIIEDNPNTWSREPPTLQDLRSALEVVAQQGKWWERDSTKEILQRIGPALGHQLFSQAKTKIPFEKLVMGPMVIDFSRFQNDLLKSLATEFLSGKIPYFTENHSGDLKLFVAFDGVQNAFGKNSAFLLLLKEARQRGIGMIYSCQNPANLDEIAFNNTATILSFRTSDSKNAKNVAEHLCVEGQVLNRNLSGKFSAVVKFSTQPDVSKLSIVPYFQKDQVNV